MRLISLNIWGGNQIQPLLEFITHEAPSTDVFCFQEVAHTAHKDVHKAMHEHGDTMLQILTDILPDFQPYFVSTHAGYNQRPVDFDLTFGNTIFVRKNLTVLEDGHVFVYGKKNAIEIPELLEKNWRSLPRLVQFVRLKEESGKEVTICNFHGLWHKDGKGDMPARIEQSNNIAALLNSIEGSKILCGDFNLNIDSESLQILEKGMRNLIKEFDIKTTRSIKHYPKIDRMPFADYTLVSPEIEIMRFSVPQTDISDHLPMILEFA